MKNIEEEDTVIMFTSDYVIDEFLNITLKLSGIVQALKWGELLFSEELVHIVYANKQIITSSWDIFQSEVNERKLMNITDCVVYFVSNSLNCDEILTFDQRLKNYIK
jgi:predicted nucleic acid-binding protein